ncbi:MAG: FCD domain-containing protein [Caulobacter sp.]
MPRSLTAAGTLSETLADDLGRLIVTGAFAMRAFPTETEICDRYRASRTVVREAVKMLIAKGLVASRARRGTTVNAEDDWNLLDPDILSWIRARKFSLDLLIEFTQLRLSVEPTAAALAAREADARRRDGIEQALARMAAAERGDEDPLAADIAFHVAVLEASGNRFHRRMRDVIEAALRFGAQRPGIELQADQHLPAHARIADAILARRPDEAEAAMRDLLLRILEPLDLTRMQKRRRL